MEATNPNWKRDAVRAKRKEEKRTGLEERAKALGAELEAAGLTEEDLFPTSWNQETRRKYAAAVYILNAPAISVAKATQYRVKAPEIAAQYRLGLQVKEIAYRAAQLVEGVPEEEVCPDYDDIKKEVSQRSR